MKYIFGPVPSRRLGLSLGVDLIPPKTCPFDCIYCEVGPTTDKTSGRREYIPAAAIEAELREYFAGPNPVPDYVTLAGSGEPTLNLGLGRLITCLRDLTPAPVAVLTNGALLHDPEVRRELRLADVIMPSLDAVSPALFQAINRPVAGLTVADLLTGLLSLRREYTGQIWLEVLLLRGLNDTAAELAKLKESIRLIEPDKIQLNTAVRPVAEQSALPLSEVEMAGIAAFFGDRAEVIASFKSNGQPQFELSDADFLATLARRPQTAADLAAVLKLPAVVVVKRLEVLIRQGRVLMARHQDKVFYQTT